MRRLEAYGSVGCGCGYSIYRMKYLVSFYFISCIDKGHMFLLDKVIFNVLSIKYFVIIILCVQGYL